MTLPKRGHVDASVARHPYPGETIIREGAVDKREVRVSTPEIQPVVAVLAHDILEERVARIVVDYEVVIEATDLDSLYVERSVGTVFTETHAVESRRMG